MNKRKVKAKIPLRLLKRSKERTGQRVPPLPHDVLRVFLAPVVGEVPHLGHRAGRRVQAPDGGVRAPRAHQQLDVRGRRGQAQGLLREAGRPGPVVPYRGRVRRPRRPTRWSG